MALITSTSRGLAGVVLFTAAVAGCAAPAGQVVAAAPGATPMPMPPPPSPDVAAPCTLIGSAEGVSIDLTGVLDPAAGSHTVQVDLAEPGVSSAAQTTAVVGPPDSFQGMFVAADLTGEPVATAVVVRDATGQQVYAGDGAATPRLFQPNGARCDGENHVLALLATASGHLVPHPEDFAEPVGTENGRPFELHTHCGIDELMLDGAWYERVGGRLDDGSGNPPDGWGNPYQQGEVTVAGTTVTFTDDTGHHETFQLREGATGPKRLCG